MKGGTQDPMLRVPIRGFGVFADEHGREASGSPHVLGDGRITQAHVIARRSSLPEMVPFRGLVQVPELVVDGGAVDPDEILVDVGAMANAVIADTGGGIPLVQVDVQHVVGSAHGIEQAVVVELFVEVIEVFGEQGTAAPLRVLPGEQARRLLHQLKQIALHEGPRRRGRDLRRFD